MELGKQSQNCEIWTQNSEKKARIVRIFEYLWNWVKSQNCENFWIFMELGKKVRIVRYELRILRKKSELWEFLNIYGIG